VSENVRLLTLVMTWYVLAALASSASKQLLMEFAHPLSLSLSQFLTATSICFGRAALAPPKTELNAKCQPLAGSWRGLCSVALQYRRLGLQLGAAVILTSVCHRFALMLMPVSFVHTVKALQPLYTALLSRFFLGTPCPRDRAASLVVIVAGVALSAVTELDYTWAGLASAQMSVLAITTSSVLQKRYMRSGFTQQRSSQDGTAATSSSERRASSGDSDDLLGVDVDEGGDDGKGHPPQSSPRKPVSLAMTPSSRSGISNTTTTTTIREDAVCLDKRSQTTTMSPRKKTKKGMHNNNNNNNSTGRTLSYAQHKFKTLTPPALVSPPYASTPELASIAAKFEREPSVQSLERAALLGDDDAAVDEDLLDELEAANTNRDDLGGDDDDNDKHWPRRPARRTSSSSTHAGAAAAAALAEQKKKRASTTTTTAVVVVPNGGVAPAPVLGSLDANAVFFLTNAFALVLLFPAWTAFDATPAMADISRGGLRVWLLLALTSLCVVAQHFASISVLEAASTPVTHAVAATCKRIFVIVTSVVWFNNHIAPLNGVGIALSVCGVALYDRSGRRANKLSSKVSGPALDNVAPASGGQPPPGMILLKKSATSSSVANGHTTKASPPSSASHTSNNPNATLTTSSSAAVNANNTAASPSNLNGLHRTHHHHHHRGPNAV